MKQNLAENARAFAGAYQTYRGLPPLAGLGSLAEAVVPGLSVAESVRCLKSAHYAFKRLHGIFLARLTSEPIYELKMAFSLHAHWCAEHVAAIRARVGEMREPPLGLDVVPQAALAWVFDEILAAPTTAELLLGVYEVVLPALQKALENHFEAAHLLAEQPTRRVLKFARLEVDEMLAYGRGAISALVTIEEREAAQSGLLGCRAVLTAMGGLEGPGPGPVPLPAPNRSAQPFRYDPIPRRDGRFPDPYNMGVNAEVFLYDPDQPVDGKVLMMFYKRLREIDVPEMMASIIVETPGKPWAYYRDLTRQLWDEARHAMMGEVGFVSLGIDWARNVMVNFTWSYGLNTQLTAKERHAVLYFIEQGLMPKTGKRHEWEVALRSANPLAATFQDYDWADEVLHARVGRDWYVSDMPSVPEAVAYGDHCWSKVLLDWGAWKRSGQTAHRNWWPDLYREYCARQGVTPVAGVMAYATTYERVRADLQECSSSG